MTKMKLWLIGMVLVGSMVQSGLAAIPIGNITGVTMNSITGWASDPDAPGVSLDVHVYCYPRGQVGPGNELWAAAIVANETRAGVTGNHAFTLADPQYQNLPEGEYDLVLYALGKDGSSANDGANLTIEMDHVGAEVAPQVISVRKDYFGYDYENERNDYIIFSQYLGIMWDEANKYDMYQSAVRTSDDGTVYCYYTKSSGSIETVFMRSSPNGIDSWTSPVQVVSMGSSGDPDSQLIADGNVIAIPDGGTNKLWLTYTAVDNPEGSNGAVFLAAGDDSDFTSFTKMSQTGPVANAVPMLSAYSYDGTYGAGQPSMFVGPDSVYHMYFTDTTIPGTTPGWPSVIHAPVYDPVNLFGFSTSLYAANRPYPSEIVPMNTSEWTYYPNLDLYLAANIYNDPAFFVGTSPTNMNGDVGRIQISWDPTRSYIAEGGLLRGLNGQITTADNGTIAYYGAGEYTNDWSRYWTTGCGATRYYLHKIEHPQHIFSDDFNTADVDDANADLAVRQDDGLVLAGYSFPTSHEIVDGMLNVYQSANFASVATNFASYITGKDFEFQITIVSNNLLTTGDWFDVYMTDGTADAGAGGDERISSRFGLSFTDAAGANPWSFALSYGTGAAREQIYVYLNHYNPAFNKATDSFTLKLVSTAVPGSLGINTVEIYVSFDGGLSFIEVTDGVTPSTNLGAIADYYSYYFDGPDRVLNMVGIFAGAGKDTGMVFDDLKITPFVEKEYLFVDDFNTSNTNDANADLTVRQTDGVVQAGYTFPTDHEIVDGKLNVYKSTYFANVQTDFASHIIGEDFEFQITVVSNNLSTSTGDWFEIYMTDGTGDASTTDERAASRFGFTVGYNDQLTNPWSFTLSHGTGAARALSYINLAHYNVAFNKATDPFTLKLISTAGVGGTNTVEVYVSFDGGYNFIEVTDGVTASTDTGTIPDSYSYYFDGPDRKLNMVGIFGGAGKETGVVLDQISLKVFLDDPPPSYEIWAESNGLSGDNALRTADIENGGLGDGANNWHEYVFGGDPNVDDATVILPTLDMSVPGNWKYIYRRRSDAAERGLTYDLQITTDLVGLPWGSTGGSYETGSTTLSPEIDEVTNESSIGSSELFFKLDVTEN